MWCYRGWSVVSMLTSRTVWEGLPIFSCSSRCWFSAARAACFFFFNSRALAFSIACSLRLCFSLVLSTAKSQEQDKRVNEESAYVQPGPSQSGGGRVIDQPWLGK